MSPSLTEFLEHIKTETAFILKHCDGLTEEAFLENDLLIHAVCRALEIIGEAAKHIPDGFRQKYPSVSWRKMTGLRDVIIHDYFGIDYETVWEIITQKIPDIHFQINEIIQLEQKKHQP